MVIVVFAITFCLLGIDQYLKLSARKDQLPESPSKSIAIFEHIENDGLACSVLRGHQKLTHMIPATCFTFLVPSLLLQWEKEDHLNHLGILLMIAGACSNLWDRIRRGTVTDMIRFSHFPGKLKTLCWNVADFMLIAGSILLMISTAIQFLKRKH